MSAKQDPLTLLVAEDDPDDRFLLEDAVAESGLDVEVEFASDGIELLDRLGEYVDQADQKREPLRVLVVLDLNMPRMDGRKTLERMKADKKLSCVPVVVLTTSQAPEDIMHSLDFSANSFFTKPTSFDGLVQLVTQLPQYWDRTRFI